MLIRDLHESDLAAVRALLRQLGYAVGPSDLRRRIGDVVSAADHHAVVATSNDEVVGLLHVYERAALEKPREAVVQALVVQQNRRGKGFGKGLMRSAEAWARNRGLDSIVLHSRIDRAEAHAFYARLGYETAATSNLLHKKLAAS